jgi:hypothetical protein
MTVSPDKMRDHRRGGTPVIPHPNNPELFLGDDGRVYRRLAETADSFGYLSVHVPPNGTTIRKHRLMWEFYNQREVPPGNVVRHVDGDPSNNARDNLQIGTQKDNAADTIRHGRTTRGSRNPMSKLTESQVKEIKARLASGEMGRAIAREFGVTDATICDIRKGRQWGWLAAD